MAKVSGLNAEIVRRLRGTVDFYYWKSVLVARKWPERSKKGWADSQLASREAFKKSRAAMAAQSDDVKNYWRLFARGKPETWPAVFTRWYMEYWKAVGSVPAAMTALVASRASPALKIDFQMCGIDAVNACVVVGQQVPAAVQFVPGKSCGKNKIVIKPGPAVCFPCTKISNMLYDCDTGWMFQGNGYQAYGTVGTTWPELFLDAWHEIETNPQGGWPFQPMYQVAKKESFAGADRALVYCGWNDIFWDADDYVLHYGQVAPDSLRVWVNALPYIGLDGTVREERFGQLHDMSSTPDWWYFQGGLKIPQLIGGHWCWWSRFNVSPYPEHFISTLGYEQRVGFQWVAWPGSRAEAFGPELCRWTVTIPESALMDPNCMIVFKDSNGFVLPAPPIQNHYVV